MEGQTILVTGGAGFIGGHLVGRFQEDNTVRILDTAAETSLSSSAPPRRACVHLMPGSIDVGCSSV
ncbi:NAD-dependent epimerase/dehydratase family protein [Halorientalis persicus]|uniref:NAD-dependent epimerase/dehydratase family protein n=1 Tax=Halorientalis persicus TaxID=1367881 RepID=UPI0011138B78